MALVALSVFCIDEYPQLAGAFPGGNSLNVATHCIRAGLPGVSCVGAVGDDQAGRSILTYLQTTRINISHLHTIPGQTAANRIYNHSNGERYSNPGDWRGGVYETYRLSESDWSFVLSHDTIAAPSVIPDFASLLARRTNRHRLVIDFLDTSDLPVIQSLLPQINIAFIGGTEAHCDALRSFCLDTRAHVIITLGHRGSRCFHNGHEYHHPALPVPKVIDTTGCGDAYQAAYLLAYSSNCPIPECMQAGAAAAAQVLQHHGAISLR